MATDLSTQHTKLILASGSRYRASLLKRLINDFNIATPSIDESPLTGELPYAMAQRLAYAKAQKVAREYPSHLILACDQVAILASKQKNNDQTIKALGKPGGFDQAFAQLSACSGQSVEFYVACTLINSAKSRVTHFNDSYTVYFRELSATTIENYLLKEQPYDCAGSIKSEGLGIALIAKQCGNDPSTLIGLPLIKLTDALKTQGLNVI